MLWGSDDIIPRIRFPSLLTDLFPRFFHMSSCPPTTPARGSKTVIAAAALDLNPDIFKANKEKQVLLLRRFNAIFLALIGSPALVAQGTGFSGWLRPGPW